MHTYIHTYIHTCIHTHTYIYTYIYFYPHSSLTATRLCGSSFSWPTCCSSALSSAISLLGASPEGTESRASKHPFNYGRFPCSIYIYIRISLAACVYVYTYTCVSLYIEGLSSISFPTNGSAAALSRILSRAVARLILWSCRDLQPIQQ